MGIRIRRGRKLGKSKVTEKFQVTIPRDVREKIGLKPGEVVEVEAIDNETIILKRDVERDPLRYLIGEKPLFKREIRVEEVEEAAESGVY